MKYFFILICNLAMFSTFGQDTLRTKELEEVICYFPQNPKFPGGDGEMWKWIKKNIEYPGEAMKKNLQGKVFVKFLVEQDGTISTPVVMKGQHEILNKEAVRVIMTFPNWIPGMLDGKPIDMFYTMPIIFKIEMGRKCK